LSDCQMAKLSNCRPLLIHLRRINSPPGELGEHSGSRQDRKDPDLLNYRLIVKVK
jgi:hypothetical protein